MPREQTYFNGLIELYTDQDCGYQYFECPKCHKGNKNWVNISHKKNCKWVKEQDLKQEWHIMSEKLKLEALKKLTSEERLVLLIFI